MKLGKRTPVFARAPLPKFRMIFYWLLADDILDEIHAAVAVAPLVVVPAHELEELAVQLDARTRVKNARVRVVDEVARGDFVLGVGKDALEVGLARFFHSGCDF